MRNIGWLEWGGALVLALGLHLGAIAGYRPEPEQGAEDVGSGGLQVSITMTAALAGADADRTGEVEGAIEPEAPPDTETAEEPAEDASHVAAPEPEPVAEQEALPEVSPEWLPEPAPIYEPEMAAEPEPDRPLESEPLPEPEPLPELEPLPVPEIEPVSEPEPDTDQVQTLPRPLAKPAIPSRPVSPEEPVAPTQVAQSPSLQPEPTEEAAQAHAAEAPVEAPAREQASQAAAPAVSRAQTQSAGRVEEGADPGQATDTATTEGGAAVAAASPDYIAQLRYWLERHKEYPREARRRRMQGVVVVALRIGRAGEIMAQEIRDASGHELLDEETLAMLRRATPLPPFPDGMEGAFMDIVVPIEYSLRGNQ
ncbi:MAG: TonB family protein [Alphaproteobacteria bacterium]